MNIFRDLVEELKEENLLEETVIDPDSRSEDSNDESSAESISDGWQMQDASTGDAAPLEAHSDAENKPFHEIETDADTGSDNPGAFAMNAVEHDPIAVDSEVGKENSSGNIGDEKERPVEHIAEQVPSDVPTTEVAAAEKAEPRAEVRTSEEERHFYKQRAMDEVTGLQLVEHVLTGVEREQMKSSPKNFDDLAVKRSLHDFLKVADNINSPEHAQAEFQLMQETENWASALSRRDRNISVSHLRRYCETTKPSLSSQAMISLARFYRNSPYSESVRSKFDLVFTKLFTKDVGNEKRAVVFKNAELVTHIQELYADWASIPLYSTAEDDPDLLLSALKFHDFIVEVNVAESFDELVKKDFFKRLKVFKEKTCENFFAPILVAAAIESNVAVGNRYVELIAGERHDADSNGIGEKYGMSHDDYISDATSKTLQLLDLLQAEKRGPQPETVKHSRKVAKTKRIKAPQVDEEQSGEDVSGGVNKWLIVAAVVVALVTGWFYFGGSATATLDPTTLRGNGTAKEFRVEGTLLKEHIISARISKSTLFGITNESWNDLSVDEKTSIVKKSLELGEENGFIKVHFLDSAGKSVAFGSDTRVKIY